MNSHRLISAAFVAALLFLIAAAPAKHTAKIVLVAGGGLGGDGASATAAKLTSPFGIDADTAGNLFFVELTGERACRIDPQGILRTIAGIGVKGDDGDGGPARQARFNGMHSLAVARNGDIYLADTWNNRVRKIDSTTGVIATIAGTGKKGFSGDGGPAVQAEFGGIYCVAFDTNQENLYLADLDNRRIREVNLKSGLVKTVAGNGQSGVPADGADAVGAPLVDPRAVAVDKRGTVYILERSGNALRAVDTRGKIRTVVGTGQKGGSGDGGKARQATLNGPKHLCVDREGNIIIADTENHLIRKFLPRDGRIVRVAGTGKKGTAGLDGSPEQVELSQPHGVFVDRAGVLYVVDSGNDRILKVTE